MNYKVDINWPSSLNPHYTQNLNIIAGFIWEFRILNSKSFFYALMLERNIHWLIRLQTTSQKLVPHISIQPQNDILPYTSTKLMDSYFIFQYFWS